MITRERLLDLLSYDETTGVFTWIKSRGGTAKAGNAAGKEENNGYVRIKIDGKLYSAHRLAYLYVYGYLPSSEIDHINRDRSDNRLSNLRLCSVSENRQNTNLRNDNTSGHKGVAWHKTTGKWIARIKHKKKTIHLGIFSDINDAVSARKSAEAMLHPFAMKEA